MKFSTAFAVVSLSLACASCYTWNQPNPEPSIDVSDLKRIVKDREQEHFEPVPQLDPARKIDEVSCADAFARDGGNLKCR